MNFMKTARIAALLILAACCQRAPAQPSAIVEPIGPVTIVPGQPLQWWFPNVIDPTHPKHMYFEGNASALGGATQGSLRITFGYYLDPADPPLDAPTFSPPIDILVSELGTPVYAEWWIPECPPWVSLQLQADEFLVVEGVFVHQCIPEHSIPESGRVGLVAGLAAIGLGFSRRHARRRASLSATAGTDPRVT